MRGKVLLRHAPGDRCHGFGAGGSRYAAHDTRTIHSLLDQVPEKGAPK
jgi:hypothetical protein